MKYEVLRTKGMKLNEANHQTGYSTENSYEDSIYSCIDNSYALSMYPHCLLYSYCPIPEETIIHQVNDASDKMVTKMTDPEGRALFVIERIIDPSLFPQD